MFLLRSAAIALPRRHDTKLLHTNPYAGISPAHRIGKIYMIWYMPVLNFTWWMALRRSQESNALGVVSLRRSSISAKAILVVACCNSSAGILVYRWGLTCQMLCCFRTGEKLRAATVPFPRGQFGFLMGTDLLEERSAAFATTKRCVLQLLWPAAAEVLRRGPTTRPPAAARATPVNGLRRTQALRPPRMKAQAAILPSQRHANVKSDKMHATSSHAHAGWVCRPEFLCQCPNGNRKR